MIDVDEALARIAATTHVLDVERVTLEGSLGRVLAERVVADRDFPPTDRSAMDGYAVRAADLVAGVARLRVVGEQRAGAAAREGVLAAGEALRIATGAIVPAGADAVVMVERTATLDEGRAVEIKVEQGVHAGDNVRSRASDLAQGATVLEPGTLVHAAEIAALASVGHVEVSVHRRPVVRVLTTGDEVVPAGSLPAPHQVRNSNAPALVAQLAQLGIVAEARGIAPDEEQALSDCVAAALDGADVLVLSGGVSVGPYDLVGGVLARHGLELDFHGVAVKPGKPVLAGRCGATRVFGLPGNPVSTFACFQLFVEPALRRLLGQRHWAPQTVRARVEQELRCRPGRRVYHLARLTHGDAGWSGRRIDATGSGDVLALCRANGFLITDAEVDRVAAGETLPALPWPQATRR